MCSKRPALSVVRPSLLFLQYFSRLDFFDHHNNNVGRASGPKRQSWRFRSEYAMDIDSYRYSARNHQDMHGGTLFKAILFGRSNNGAVYCLVTSMAVHYGYGKHIALFNSEALEKVTIWIALDVVLGVLLTMVSRCLNLVMINEVMPMPKLPLRSRMPSATISSPALCWPLVLMSAVPLAWIIVFLSTLNKFENIQKSGILCHSPALVINMTYADGVFAAIFYTCLTIFPVYRVWQLELSVRKRLTCCLMLSLPIMCVVLYEGSAVTD
ncbi:unnamed protein product [Penicillium olsonii]|uniref:Uncharacterized protein n=1 Tax=Penicillium olsonii TaxID=99116 RepID=A0A9W4I456_PENOL|nr:unnamed protein product [Penicillium olsonii]